MPMLMRQMMIILIKKMKKKFVYAQKSSDYKEITDAAVRTPYVALLDVNNNKIIAGREAESRIYPASMTKVMSLIVAVENVKDVTKMYQFTNKLLYPLYNAQASVAGFGTNEIVPVSDLFQPPCCRNRRFPSPWLHCNS